MSNHFSADNLKFPGDDRRLDLTDVFMFTSPDDPDKTVLIMDSNPTSAPPPIPAPVTGPEFYPGAFYRINIDTDGDNQADVAFTFVFSEYENGTQTGTVWYATGAVARQLEPAGEVIASDIPVSFDGTARPVQAGRIRLCAGLRSDPFFADVEGALHGFVWTGHDDFADNNVDSIALEVPADMLGGPVDRRVGLDQPVPRTACSSSWTAAGTRPSTRSSTPTARRTSSTPASPPTTWPTTWARGRRSWKTPAATSPEAAKAAALQVLPDILHYDRTKPATYPNGRVTTDDVYSIRFAWLTNGKVPPSGLKPHDDLLAHFPYLGPPNP